jgi:signal transduction histidine kinase
VAALVRNLGGSIAAYSEGHMKGTRISVKLPVAVAASETA